MGKISRKIIYRMEKIKNLVNCSKLLWHFFHKWSNVQEYECNFKSYLFLFFVLYVIRNLFHDMKMKSFSNN